MNETTLLFDTEKGSESYVHLYASEAGVPADRPLWPAPIPVIGVSGKIGQGKTTFLLDIAAGPVRRVDVPAEMLKLHPGGYRPMDTFAWFHAVVKSIPPGKFRVIALDVAEEIEQGVAEWVWENPLHFNTTRQQFIKMSGVYQGLVSSYWKSILMDITSRCETFAFANHTGLVFDSSGKAVAGKEKSKGRPVMKQSASLYVNLTREKDASGGLKDIPAGVVDLTEGGKSRLMTWAVRGGVRIKVPVLPPRMPVATPAAIREYFVNPPDTSRLAPAMLAPEHVTTEDDRAQTRLQAIEAESQLEQLKLQRLEAERRAAAVSGSADESPVEFEEEPTTAQAPAVESAPAPVAPPTTVSPAVQQPPAGADSAAGEKKPRAKRSGKLPRGSIVAWLTARSHPVNVNELFAAMFEEHGADAAKVHAACKVLRDGGEVKIVQQGDVVSIGLPTAKFPAVESLPAATAVVGPAPVPAAANLPAVNGQTPGAGSTAGSGPAGGTNGTHVNGTPAPPVASAWIRPACLAPVVASSIAALWSEFCHLQGWPLEQRGVIWGQHVLSRFNAITDRDLSEADQLTIEEMLCRKIDAHYVQKGTPQASPFLGALAAGALPAGTP